MTLRKSLIAALMAGAAFINFGTSAGWAQVQIGPGQMAPQRSGGMVPTPDYFGSMWGSLTPEQKFGAFVEAFWAFARENTGSVNCRPDERSHKACLARQGYTFEASYPGECRVTFAEQIPLPERVEKTWDGQVTGSYPIGRRLTIDLHGLRKDLIKDDLRLFFDERSAEKLRVEVRLTSNPNEWVAIQNPPSIDGVQGQTDEDRVRKFKGLRMQWGAQATQVSGSTNLPYFSHWFAGMDLPTEQAVNVYRHVLYVMSPPNRQQPVSLFSPASSQNADALFVDALKSVIAKCPQQ